MSIDFTDALGDSCLPVGDLPMHPEMGPYHYLNHGDAMDEVVTRLRVAVPPGSSNLIITGRQWRKDRPIHLTRSVRVEPVHEDLAGDSTMADMVAFIQELPTDAHLIVLDTTAPPLGHETLALRPNRLASEYAAQGAWVVFFPFGTLQGHEWEVSERVRQYPRSMFDEFVNAALFAAPRCKTYICSSFPDVQAVAATDVLSAAGWRTVYEVRDDMEEFNRVGYSKWFHPNLEARVATRADVVVTVSPRLAEKMDIISGAPKSLL